MLKYVPLANSVLSRRQLLTAVAVGVFFWFLGVLLVRNAPWLHGSRAASLLHMAMQIPAGAFSLAVLDRAVRPETALIRVAAVLAACAAAALLDGTLLALLPDLYGGVSVSTHHGAALLLWAFGVIMLMAVPKDIKEE